MTAAMANLPSLHGQKRNQKNAPRSSGYKKPGAHTNPASETSTAPTDQAEEKEKRESMRMYPKEFPPARLKIPKRRAERRVYEALADCGRQGFCYYEWRKGHEQIELDFAVWIEGLGRFALQVKGGCYRLIDGDWRLQTREGLKTVASSPLDETKIAALDLHDDVKERAKTDYNPFVIPLLVFPDKHGDSDIDRLASRQGVYVVWGTANLPDNLEGHRARAQRARVPRLRTDRQRSTCRYGWADPAEGGSRCARSRPGQWRSPPCRP